MFLYHRKNNPEVASRRVRWQVGEKRHGSGDVPGDRSPIGALNHKTGLLAGTSVRG